MSDNIDTIALFTDSPSESRPQNLASEPDSTPQTSAARASASESETPARKKRRRRRRRRKPSPGAAAEAELARSGPSAPQATPIANVPEQGQGAEAAPTQPPARKKRKPRPRHAKSPKRVAAPTPRHAPITPEEHARAAVDALHNLLRALAEERGLDGALPVEQMALPLHLTVGGQQRADEARTLVGNISRRVDDALRAAGSWRQGYVYCFQCGEPGCRHASPPHLAAVFAGYNVSGRPNWQGFTELCIERSDSRLERIFGDSPEVIAITQSGDSLSQGVLPELGGAGHPLAVLGQVVAGLLPAVYSGKEGHDRVAITIQIVELPGAKRGGRLRLNLIGTSWQAIAEVLADEGPRSPAEGLRSALAAARHRLRAQSRHLARRERRGDTPDLQALVQPVLLDLQRDIERVLRGHRWRTKHAEHRHRSGERPTLAAVSEAQGAPTNRLLSDSERKTIVVLGRKGRAHVFSDEGRHVTSIQLKPGEVERKTHRRRWRPVTEQVASEFRAAVGERGNID